MAKKQITLALDSIRAVVKSEINNAFDRFEEHFDKKIDGTKEELRAEFKHLPTRQQYYAREDKTMGELKKLGDEVTFTSDLYEKTNKRVNIIDKHLGIDTSVVFS